MNQRQRNLIREALELKALQDDEDTPEYLELLEQVDQLQFMSRPGTVTPSGYKPRFGPRDCSACGSKLELQVIDGARWPYCVRCGKRRHRALSVEDAIKFQKGELQL